MAACSSCGGLGGRVTVGGWIQCSSCGGSGQQFWGRLRAFVQGWRSA